MKKYNTSFDIFRLNLADNSKNDNSIDNSRWHLGTLKI